jgi:hypothetical protein
MAHCRVCSSATGKRERETSHDKKLDHHCGFGGHEDGLLGAIGRSTSRSGSDAVV